MSVALNIVKNKYGFITPRQHVDSRLNVDSVYHPLKIKVRFRENAKQLAIILKQPAERIIFVPVFSETHQHEVGRQPVQPRRQRRIAPKCVQFAKYMDENVLRGIFGLYRISQHAQANATNEFTVGFEDFFKCPGVALAKRAFNTTHRCTAGRSCIQFPHAPSLVIR